MSDEKIKIKNFNTNLELNREDIIEIKQTHDGIVFNLRDGLHLYATDTYMPVDVKQKIITAFDRFKNVDLSIDLKNYVIPATAVVKQ